MTSARTGKERGLDAAGAVRRVRDRGRPARGIGIGPVPAIPKALKIAGLTLEEIDLVELNEAFAAQALACLQAMPSTSAG